MKRRPCPSCPWRKSTPQRGFPGGWVMADVLLAMVSGADLRAMQCHCTPDDDPKVCVGFALQVGAESAGFRLAVAMGLVSPDEFEADEDLHDLRGILSTHGGRPA